MRSLLPLAAALILLAACSEEKDGRGLEVLPDMFHTPADKSQVAERRVETAADGARREVHAPAMLSPPEGTVPRDGAPYALAANDWAGARRLANPVAPTAAVLREGQRLFNIHCAACHGRDGDPQKAHVGRFFSGVPGFGGANIAVYADGELFHILTVGKARMTPLGGVLLPEQRWSVVHYLRALNRAHLAVAEAKAVQQSLEGDLKAYDDPTGRDRAVRARAVLTQREADLKALLSAGDGAAFRPAPPPRPEWQEPAWPVPGGRP